MKTSESGITDRAARVRKDPWASGCLQPIIVYWGPATVHISLATENVEDQAHKDMGITTEIHNLSMWSQKFILSSTIIIVRL